MPREVELVSKRVAKEREAFRRHCTGDPNTCKKSYNVPADPETPICGINGAECDRGSTRDRVLLRGPR